MEGWMFKQNVALEDDDTILDSLFGAVTETISFAADGVYKNRSKRWFKIKNRTLFWYLDPEANKAENHIAISEIKQVNRHVKHKKVIEVFVPKKCYRLEAPTKDQAEEWAKSLDLVMSQSEDYLNLDRYVNTKVFERVSGETLFRDYEVIYEEVRQRI